jgi:hypothetical protein
MIIMINTDTNINIAGSGNNNAQMEARISSALTHYSDKISRLEVHLSDENGQKSGPNDKRCMMEARIEGMQPIAVSKQAGTIEQAYSGALDKMASSLHSIFGKLKTY